MLPRPRKPGETEEEYQRLVRAVENAGLDRMSKGATGKPPQPIDVKPDAALHPDPDDEPEEGAESA